MSSSARVPSRAVVRQQHWKVLASVAVKKILFLYTVKLTLNLKTSISVEIIKSI